MKIIFAGTPHFAEQALQALLEKKENVVAVLTQPDRPAGRGMQLKPSPVKQLALDKGLPVLQPKTLRNPEVQQQLVELEADLMIVAAYGLILPKAVLDIPRLGCLNIHASLLPRWRGAAPIQRAILAGDEKTGITIMQMDEGLDTGDMLYKLDCPIAPNDTSGVLHDKLAKLGATAITNALALLRQNKAIKEPQNNQLVTYAAKLTKEESQIDWSQDAEAIVRAIRGYNPFPGASSTFNEIPIKIWQAKKCDGFTGNPGEVLSVNKEGLVVACGAGAVSLEMLQKPNAKALPTLAFLQGFSIKTGDRFEP